MESELRDMRHRWGTVEKLAKDGTVWRSFVTALNTSGITGS